ncbi:MAG: hypothetical protein ACLR8P_16560 [Clostridium fessum]
MRKQTKLVAKYFLAAALLAVGASMTSFAGCEKDETLVSGTTMTAMATASTTSGEKKTAPSGSTSTRMATC